MPGPLSGGHGAGHTRLLREPRTQGLVPGRVGSARGPAGTAGVHPRHMSQTLARRVQVRRTGARPRAAAGGGQADTALLQSSGPAQRGAPCLLREAAHRRPRRRGGHDQSHEGLACPLGHCGHRPWALVNASLGEAQSGRRASLDRRSPRRRPAGRDGAWRALHDGLRGVTHSTG